MMMDLFFTIEVATTTARDVYLPVPYRGVVVGARAVYSEETDLDETVDIQRDTTSVNLITPPADTTAEGVLITGMPDATNNQLVFDPADATVANRRFHIVIPNTYDTAGMLGINILFDTSAYVTQDASEA